MKLFSPPHLTGKYLCKVLDQGWLTTGPMCQRLQEAVGRFLDVDPARVVLASSATAGFQAVLDLLQSRYDMSIGVKITDATWPGMHQVIRHVGGRRDNKTPDVVVFTDIGGRLCYEQEGEDWICGDREIIIHDACHSWQPHRYADFGLVSFYPTKLVAGAEGGAVICKKVEDAIELRSWLYCGLVPGSAGEGTVPRVPGRKANMTDVQAALNLEALEQAGDRIERTSWAWTALAQMARELGVPYRDQPVRAYLFQVEVDAERVPQVRKRLKALGIPSAWNFRPAPLVTIPCTFDLTLDGADDLMVKVKECL